MFSCSFSHQHENLCSPSFSKIGIFVHKTNSFPAENFSGMTACLPSFTSFQPISSFDDDHPTFLLFLFPDVIIF
jgi:hypothetical protein